MKVLSIALLIGVAALASEGRYGVTAKVLPSKGAAAAGRFGTDLPQMRETVESLLSALEPQLKVELVKPRVKAVFAFLKKNLKNFDAAKEVLAMAEMFVDLIATQTAMAAQKLLNEAKKLQKKIFDGNIIGTEDDN